MQDIDIKQTISGIYSDIVDLHVETQSILQLMVAKNLVTPDEVADMRKTVKKNSKIIRQEINILNSMKTSISQQSRDVELYNKMLNNRDSLTEAERKEIDELVNDKERAARVFANVGLLK